MSWTTNILSGAFLTSLAFTAHAGWYAGAGLGPDTIDFKQRSHVTQTGSQGFDVINKTNLSGTGVFGTIFAGYGKLVNKLYLAAEINGNVSSSSFLTSNHEYVHSNFSDTRLKLPNSYGVSILPGYQVIESTLFYGRLGYSNAKFKSSTSDTSLSNISTRLDGFRYGLGLKQMLTKRVAVRVDYSRIDYQHIQMATLDTGSSTTKNTTIKPNQQLVELGVVVNFGS